MLHCSRDGATAGERGGGGGWWVGMEGKFGQATDAHRANSSSKNECKDVSCMHLPVCVVGSVILAASKMMSNR